MLLFVLLIVNSNRIDDSPAISNDAGIFASEMTGGYQ